MTGSLLASLLQKSMKSNVPGTPAGGVDMFDCRIMALTLGVFCSSVGSLPVCALQPDTALLNNKKLLKGSAERTAVSSSLPQLEKFGVACSSKSKAVIPAVVEVVQPYS